MAPRNRAWADTRFAGVSLVAGTDILTDLLSDAPTVDTLTAIRIVGDIEAHYVITNTITDSDSVVDVGIGVSATEAFAAGVGAIPDPSVTNKYPPRGWLYVATQYVGQALTTSTGMFSKNARFQFDIRSMRKIDKGRMFIRVANTNINVGGAMELTGRVRVLCLT